jgi:hypothetical protein
MSGNESESHHHYLGHDAQLQHYNLGTVGPLAHEEKGLIRYCLDLIFTEEEFNRYSIINTVLSSLSTSTFVALVFRNVVTGLDPNGLSKEARYAIATFIAVIMVAPGQFILTHQFIKKMMDKLVESGGATFKESSFARILKYFATTGAAFGTGCGTFHLETSTHFFSNPTTAWLPTDSLTARMLVASTFGAINGGFRAVFFNGKKKYTPGNEIQNEWIRKLGQGVALLSAALYGYTNAINYVASYVLMVEGIEDEGARNIAINILIGAFGSIVLGEIPKNIEVLWNTFRLYKSEPEPESNPVRDVLYGLLRGGFGLLSALSKTASSTLSFCLLVLKAFPASKTDVISWSLLLPAVLLPTLGYNIVTAGMTEQVETIPSGETTRLNPSINETREDFGSAEKGGSCFTWLQSFWATEPSPVDIVESVAIDIDPDYDSTDSMIIDRGPGYNTMDGVNAGNENPRGSSGGLGFWAPSPPNPSSSWLRAVSDITSYLTGGGPMPFNPTASA